MLFSRFTRGNTAIFFLLMTGIFEKTYKPGQRRRTLRNQTRGYLSIFDEES